MGCIAVSVERRSGIEASAQRVGGVSCSASRDGGLSAHISRVGGISVTAFREDSVKVLSQRRDKIEVHVSLFCEIGKGQYLLVRPKETQWVTVEVGADYHVISNVDWDVI